MKHLYPRLRAALALLGLSTLGAQAQQAAPLLFQDAVAAAPSAQRLALRQSRALTLDRAAMQAALATAPPEGRAGAPPLVLALPLPDGSTGQFRVVEAPIMEAGLAAQFPGIRTYRGVGVSDPTATLRLDCTPQGFHAQVLSPTTGGFFIDPAAPASLTQVLSFWRRDMPDKAYACDATGSGAAGARTAAAGLRTSGPTLRTYRLAVAATAEYTAAKGGTVAAAQAAIVSTINRVVGVYEKELAVRLVLVANNAAIIYTNAATDPYDNTNPNRILLTQNQTNLDNVIGTANYDIGHVFGTTVGGTTNRGGTVCSATNKAQGTSGIGSKTGDAFDVAYAAHELGHQLGANHTFNSVTGLCTAARVATSAYEPGSGSTIMSYAGICGAADNVQAAPDAYFHVASYEQIQAYLDLSQSQAGGCGGATSSGNSNPPSLALLPASGKVLPIGTPFKLTASGYDVDNPSAPNVTYCWEEYDLGNAASLTDPQTAGTGSTVPLFRSFAPTTSPTRYFPRLSDVVAGTTSPGERLPTVARPLNFRVTLRDMFVPATAGAGVNAGMGPVGGVNSSALVSLSTTSAAGPFVDTSRNPPRTTTGGNSAQNVTWSVAGTTANGVNCATVNIRLSTDGGLTYPTLLAAGVPNSGARSIRVPSLNTTTARLLVEAADNYFYDISDTNFTISASPVCPPPTSVAVSNLTRTSATVTFGGGSPATGYVLTTSPATTTYTASASPVSLTGLAAGTAYTVYVQSGCAASAVSGAAAATFTTLAPAACSAPTSLVASSITATSATVSFMPSPSSPAGYSYALTTSSPSPTTAPAYQPLTGTSLNLTNLASSTSYTVSIRSNCADGGFGVATVVFRTNVANDECAGAIALYPQNNCQPTPGTVAGATQSMVPANCSGRGSSDAFDVWYTFAGAANTAYNVQLTSAFNGLFELYKGACGSLTQVACVNNVGMGGTETLTVPATAAAATYYLRVYAFNTATSAGLPPASISGFTICLTGQSTVWTGVTSTDWFTASNWSAGVPTATVNAIIPAVSSSRYLATLTTGTASTLDLLLNSGGQLLVNGGLLTVNGNLTIDNASFGSTKGTLTQTAGTVRLVGALTNNGVLKQNAGATVIVSGASSGTGTGKTAVVINGGTDIAGESPIDFWNLTVEDAAASLSSPAGITVQGVLTLHRDLITNENPFTLRTGYSAGQPHDALVVNDGGTVVGTASVQRVIDPSLNPGLGYRHYSAPVRNSNVADLATPTFAPVLNPAYNTSATPSAETPFPTVFGYDDSRLGLANSLGSFDKGYYSPADPSEVLAVGRGYAVNLSAADTVDFRGPLNNGDQALALTSTRTTYPDGGWQLLGNPYPAPLDYSQVLAADRAGLEAALYVYSSTSQYAGRYRSYINGIGNPVLPVGQGFFVRVATGQPTATMTFRNRQRLTALTTTSFQRPAADPRPLVQLTLQGPGAALADEATVYFENGATVDFDAGFDAEKLANPTGLNLATSLAGGRQLSIDGQPELGARPRVVPLALGVPVAGVYAFTASQLLNLSAVPVYLRDQLLGTLTDLRQQPSYQFTVATAVGLSTTRFALVFSPQQVLATVPTALAQQVAVYPNPAKTQVAIELPPSLSRQAVAVSLLDALGRAVRAQVLPAGPATHTLPLGGLAPGIYSLRLTTEQGTLVQKLIIE